LLSLQIAAADAAARSYEVGLIQRTPVPELTETNQMELSALTRSAMHIKQKADSADEITHIFLLPALLQKEGPTIAQCAVTWNEQRQSLAVKLDAIRRELDNIAYRLYGLREEDQEIIELVSTKKNSFSEADDDDPRETEFKETPEALIIGLISYALGAIFGRWDLRLATKQKTLPDLPDPFEALPVCSMGMLQDEDGYPLETSPEGYPIRISWTGILPEDSSHPDDVNRRVQKILDVLWGDQAHVIEQEACESLGVKDLRDYFHRPVGFFADHLKRYSKSRRKAPIYWPLSTASGSYTLWLYYHRLTDQTMYSCVQDYVNPKLAEVERENARLQSEIAQGGTVAQRQKLENLQNFAQELQDFREELLRVAPSYKPNLNDGVFITAAPLWKLFRLPKWRRDLEDCWKKLSAGEYDWAHLAYTIWPDRVKEKCKTDKSLAIAHDLENLYEGEVKTTKKRKKKGEAG
jgi:hypothetical protein